MNTVILLKYLTNKFEIQHCLRNSTERKKRANGNHSHSFTFLSPSYRCTGTFNRHIIRLHLASNELQFYFSERVINL